MPPDQCLEGGVIPVDRVPLEDLPLREPGDGPPLEEPPDLPDKSAASTGCHVAHPRDSIAPPS